MLTKYGVGAAEYSFRQQDGSFKSELCVTFPWIDNHDGSERLVRLKVDGLWLGWMAVAKANAPTATRKL